MKVVIAIDAFKGSLSSLAAGNAAADGIRKANSDAEKGIDAFFPVLQTVCDAETAMQPENAANNLASTAEQVFRFYAVCH